MFGGVGVTEPKIVFFLSINAFFVEHFPGANPELYVFTRLRRSREAQPIRQPRFGTEHYELYELTL